MKMFRVRKTSEAEPEAPASGEHLIVAEDPPIRAAAQKLPALPGRPLAGPTFPIDIPRRGSDAAVPAGTTARQEAPSAPNRDKTIVIGREVRLSGQVHVCDRLILDGDAELAVGNCRLLQIGPSGTFRGAVEVTDADIGGSFEGQLTVSERLTVRATGRVTGTVRYGQIVVEAGGRMCGDVSAIDDAGLSARGDGGRAAWTSAAEVAAERRTSAESEFVVAMTDRA